MVHRVPSVSICIPVFNCEKFIGKAIDSVLKQTFSDYELIILNNQSTDNTLNIVQSYVDPRIKIISHSINIGAEGNWNFAMKSATGQYIKILCADDVIYPTCIEKNVEIFEKDSHHQISLIASKRDIINGNDNIIIKARGLGPLKGQVTAKQVMKSLVGKGTNLIGETSSAMFRMEAASRAGLFTSKIPYLIDLDYWCRLLKFGDFFALDEGLSAFRISNSSWSFDLVRKQASQTRALMYQLYTENREFISTTTLYKGYLKSEMNAFFRKVLYQFV